MCKATAGRLDRQSQERGLRTRKVLHIKCLHFQVQPLVNLMRMAASAEDRRGEDSVGPSRPIRRQSRQGEGRSDELSRAARPDNACSEAKCSKSECTVVAAIWLRRSWNFLGIFQISTEFPLIPGVLAASKMQSFQNI